jgi:general secretion pathway protein B
MSYILEALKKSERERQKAQAPTLPDLIVEGPPRHRAHGRWIAIAASLLSVNAALLAYLWMARSGESARRPPPQVAAATPQPQSAAGATAAPADLEKQALNLKLKELESRVAKIDSAQASADPKGQAAIPASAAMPPPPPTIRKPPATPLPSARPAVPKAPQSEPSRRQTPELDETEGYDPAPPDRPVALRRPEHLEPLPAAEPVRDPMRSVAELPPTLQQKLPALKINLLAYSSSPSERFAVVDMVRYSPGARLPGGALLLDIHPDGLVLELDGEKFKVRHR